jgi:hypothetical protein
MEEAQLSGMQEMPDRLLVSGGGYRVTAVNRIPDDWMAEESHVGPKLVSRPGRHPQTNKGEPTAVTDDTEVGFCGAAPPQSPAREGIPQHFYSPASPGLARHRLVDHTLGFRATVHDREVTLYHPPLLELEAESLEGRGLTSCQK